MPARALALVMAVVISFAAPSVAQDSAEEGARRDLLVQAEQARTAGNPQRALDLATRAGQIRMTPSVRLMIAQLHDSVGHFVVSLGMARQCAREAEADTALANRQRVIDACNALATSLEPRVGRLRVMVADPHPGGLVVRVGGSPINAALLEVAYPVMPGRTVIDATANGMRPFHTEATVTAGQTAEVSVSFQATAVPAMGTANTATPASTRPMVATAPSATQTTRRGPGAGPFIVAGVGVVGLAMAGVFWALHEGALADREAACDAGGCDDVARDHDAAMRTYTTATNVSLVAGAVALVGGGIWLAVGLAGRRSEAPRSTVARLSLAPVAGGAVVSLAGGF